jgi:hypothetical protein
MGGKVIPEMYNGGIEELLEKQRELAEAAILCFRPPSGTSPMSDADWASIFDAFRQGYRASSTLLLLKSHYIQVLPLAFSGLAVEDEEQARVNGRKARELWRSSKPDAAVHDPRTWRLMQPGAIFATELDKFCDDEAVHRDQLDPIFLEEVAIFRFLYAIETLVEARHARAAVELKKHYLGPVKISLSSRLAMLEMWLAIGFVTGQDLLRCFNSARDLLGVPEKLGLSCHPTLNPYQDGRKVKPSDYRKRIASVVYRCDMIDMYRGLAKEKKHHEAEQRRKITAAVKSAAGLALPPCFLLCKYNIL